MLEESSAKQKLVEFPSENILIIFLREMLLKTEERTKNMLPYSAFCSLLNEK